MIDQVMMAQTDKILIFIYYWLIKKIVDRKKMYFFVLFCYVICHMVLQYRHLIPAPVNWTSASTVLYIKPWLTCQ